MIVDDVSDPRLIGKIPYQAFFIFVEGDRL